MISVIVATISLVFVLFQSTSVSQSVTGLANAQLSSEMQSNLQYFDAYYMDLDSSENMRLSLVVSHACFYGDRDQDLFFELKDGYGGDFFTREFINQYREEAFTGNVMIESDCGYNQSKIRIGSRPKTLDRTFVESMEIPLPNGNRTEVRLVRW